MMGNITFSDFCCFSMYESLHVAVKMYINCSFFTFMITHIIYMSCTTFSLGVHTTSVFAR